MSTWSLSSSQTQSSESTHTDGIDAESRIENNDISGVDTEIGLDRVFGVLKNQRRRRILRYLITYDDTVTIGTLAEHIAVLENDTTQTALTSRERKRVYIGLYQNHLPKMDDAGAIKFDKARGTIASGPNAAQFEPYLAEPQESNSWSRYYLLLAGIGGLLFTIQSVVAPIDLSLTPLLVGILGGFVLLSTVHLRASEWFFFSWRATE
jgi:hypothetical protein